MNKTNICWCDRTFNPVTGCLGPDGKGPCDFCYARKLAEGRLRGRCGYPADDPFKPTFHGYRLNEPERVKKPSRIFVSSMGDLFGKWVDDEWIFRVFYMCQVASQHKYFFLTKNPKRYSEVLKKWDFTPPDNWYFGVSVENQAATDERIPLLLKVPAKRFVSVEPLIGPVRLNKCFGDMGDLFHCDSCGTMSCAADITHFWCPECSEMRHKSNDIFDDNGLDVCKHCKKFEVIYSECECCPKCNESEPAVFGTVGTHGNWKGLLDWIIIGAQTRPDVKPKREWVDEIITRSHDADIPVWCKDNLCRYWQNLPQERER